MNKQQLEAMHPLEIKALLAFQTDEPLDLERVQALSGLEEAKIRRPLEWLLTRNAVEVIAEETRQFVSLTELGCEYASKKIPELRILEHAAQPVTSQEVQTAAGLVPDEIGSAIGALRKGGFITFREEGRFQSMDSVDKSSFERTQKLIEKYAAQKEIPAVQIPEGERAEIESLSRKRGKSKGIFRIDERVFKTYRLTAHGKEILEAVLACGMTGEETSRVQPEHLKDGKWRSMQFRRYCLDLKPPRLITGKRNPYRVFLDFVKRKLLSLGFEEMTGDHVEPEFWNMDALFMPQFHSARDIHDVYIVKDPSQASVIEEPYFSKVADMHTNGGGTASRGWGYVFDKQRSKRLVLRSQGTALSARWLHKAKVPGKYFAMARCFRYDNVDATHAADFFQIEGIVLAENNNFCTLLGLLKLFATEVAKAEEIKFVPGYFPFTEPSVEAHIKHPSIGWMEMGGAGIFRPEVITPQGVDVPVIAWGLGLDRMAMVAMGINDIRDLFTTDLSLIRSTRVNFEM
jgi:phenylalanyl-tRNA synthetase alpha chain